MKKYPSKLLLFGEYSILVGSMAMAIPLEKYYAQWRFGNSENSIESRKSITDFIPFLESINQDNFLNLSKLENDLNTGIYLFSNIPTGYGLGSSGSLCAAILDRYGLNNNYSLKEARIILKRMEGFFHGNSSGIDPLVSYFNSAILIQDSDIDIIENFNLSKGFFLIDTNKKRNTSHLVDIFNSKLKNKSFSNIIYNELTPSVNKAIQNLIDQKKIDAHLKNISRFQFDNFKEMIPKNYNNLWKDGLENNNYYLKLLGAGGGGFLLGYSPKMVQKLYFDITIL